MNFTAFALSFKADGCDTAECACVLSSSLAMATALHQAGSEQGQDHLRRRADAGHLSERTGRGRCRQGRYFPGIESSPTYTNAASLAFLAELKKYDPSYKGGLPDLGAADGWPVANLMVEGLQQAGKNPTRKSFITNLRKVSNWTDSGLATGPISFVALRAEPADSVLLVRAVRQQEVRAVPEERQGLLRDDPPRHRNLGVPEIG